MPESPEPALLIARGDYLGQTTVPASEALLATWLAVYASPEQPMQRRWEELYAKGQRYVATWESIYEETA